MVFEEQLTPSPSVYAALALAGPMVLLAALPFSIDLAVILGVFVPLALMLLARSLSTRLSVGEFLSVGKFSIPLEALGEATYFEGEQARLERGPRLDSRAQLAIRGDVDAVVKIAVDDPRDPTPYVLVSTRRPAELVAALRANRT